VFESRKVKKFLFFASRPVLGTTQPPIQWISGDLSRVVKRPGREADHSPPNNAEVKKMCIIPPAPIPPSWGSAEGQLYLFLPLHRLRVPRRIFGPKRDEVTGGYRKVLHNFVLLTKYN
jgi:hypothetical protein